MLDCKAKFQIMYLYIFDGNGAVEQYTKQIDVSEFVHYVIKTT